MVRGLLTASDSLTVEHRLRVLGAQQFWHMGSVVVTSRLQSTGSVAMEPRVSCSTACGIFLNQDLNLCLLHGQADSLPRSHQGSPNLHLNSVGIKLFSLEDSCGQNDLE